MHAEYKEPLGFLCRWCLLGLAGVVGLIAAWTALSSTVVSATETPGGIVSPDLICRPLDKEFADMWCYPTRPVSQLSAPIVMGAFGDGFQSVGFTYGKRILLRVPPRKEGLFSIRVSGIPYSPLAFHNSQSLLLVVREAKKVFLIDAAILSVISSEPEKSYWCKCLNEMRELGTVVFFHSGGIDKYEKMKEKIRRRYPEIPLLFAYHKGKTNLRITLQKVKSVLNPRGNLRQKIAVITPRTELADYTAGRGYPTHLIGQFEPTVKPMKNLYRHKTISDLEYYLFSLSGLWEGM